MKYKIYKSIDNWIYVAFKYNCLRIINRLLLIFNKKVNLNLVIRYKNGMKMMIPSESLNNYFNPLSIYHEYFSEFKEHYPEFVINELDICIDIGAHIGFLLIPALIETPKINYYCFEADKNNYKRLKENIRLNKITSSNIIVENTAISDVDGEMEFIKGKTSTTGRLKNIKSYKIKNGKRSYFGKNGKASVIKSARLDSIYKKNNITYCQLLKIDIEGGEYLLFKGGMNFLKHTKYMVIELHPVEDYHSSEIINEIQKAGFTIKTKHYKNGCSILYCNNLNLI